MKLTTAQLADLKLWVQTNNAGVFDATAVTKLNALADPEYRVWNRLTSVAAILDKVNYTNFTPNDAPNQANALDAATWENRAMLIQIKQINLQLLMQGRETFDASKTTLRAGLQDCTESLPSGNNGASRNGGWTNIQPVLSRAATVGEKLFATGAGSIASPATLGTGADGLPCEGPVTLAQVEASDS